jgi:hypothetical protein
MVWPSVEQEVQIMSLRAQVLKLAHAVPETRKYLVPALRRASTGLPEEGVVGFLLNFDVNFWDAVQKGDPEAMRAEAERQAMGPERWEKIQKANAIKDIERIFGVTVKCGPPDRMMGNLDCDVVAGMTPKKLRKILRVLKRGDAGWAMLPATYVYWGALTVKPYGDWRQQIGDGEESDYDLILEWLEDHGV